MFFGNVTQITYTQRLIYALSRDGAIPHSEYFEKVDPATQAPLNALIPILIIQVPILVLYVLCENAFNLLGGISTLTYILPYLITIAASYWNTRNDYRGNKFSLGRHSKIIN